MTNGENMSEQTGSHRHTGSHKVANESFTLDELRELVGERSSDKPTDPLWYRAANRFGALTVLAAAALYLMSTLGAKAVTRYYEDQKAERHAQTARFDKVLEAGRKERMKWLERLDQLVKIGEKTNDRLDRLVHLREQGRAFRRGTQRHR